MSDGSAPHLSFFAMLAHADPVVQSVVALLGLTSVASWAIMIAKAGRLWATRRSVGRVEAFARDAAALDGDVLLSRLIEGVESETSAAHARADLRSRAEATLRAICLAELRANEGGLSFLATVASAAPFVGLFGTVWGIMHSFTSIAEAQDTSLAAVAPGIAEALLATAVGLAAAIPAVIGYNQFRAGFARCGQRLAVACAAMARRATLASTA